MQLLNSFVVMMCVALCVGLGGCARKSNCPALQPEALTAKQIKQNKKRSGKERGLFSNTTNKSTRYKNTKAYKSKKKKQDKKK